MSAITIESLGISKDELIDRVVKRAVDTLLRSYITHDDDEDNDEEDTSPSAFADAMEKKVREKIDQSIDAIAAKNVLPNVASYVENLCLQETNRWGEKTGKPLTFTEYLVQRAEHYLTEEVNHNGKTKAEDGYQWSKNTTRVAYLVNKHLQYSIAVAMNEAMKNANNAIVGGIEKAIKIQLDQVAQKLKIDVKT